ncbi:MAG: riboflavin synthase [Candidatus Omnitrophica bacterium]|nr:riboflavin synthase [Candidatus Omnitrophota bacterium]
MTRKDGLVRVAIEAPQVSKKVGVMESVAVNGVCLTVVSIRGSMLEFEMVSQTQRLTSLGSLRVGSCVNLEPSLSLRDRLNGHWLLGHIDGVGEVIQRRQKPGELVLTIQVPVSWKKWIVAKGSIAVDGVSLTVGQLHGKAAFSVYLIPETLRQTTLGDRRVGDRLNIETDYLAKLVRKAL